MRELVRIQNYAEHYGLNYEKVLENVIALMSSYNYEDAFEVAEEMIASGKWNYLSK